jgi:hypothetical protein
MSPTQEIDCPSPAEDDAAHLTDEQRAMKRRYATMIPPALQVEWVRDFVGGVEHPLCHCCKHYHEDGKCDAFRGYAPYDIVITGKIDHRTPVAGDPGSSTKRRSSSPRAYRTGHVLDSNAA